MAASPSGDAPRVRVSVTCAETVTERGTRKITWLKRDAARWAPVMTQPTDAGAERAAPGTIWQAQIELELHPGSWLLRVDSLPAPNQHLDPLAYLRRETRGSARRVVRRYYRVQRDGSLVEGHPTRAELDAR